MYSVLLLAGLVRSPSRLINFVMSVIEICILVHLTGMNSVRPVAGITKTSDGEVPWHPSLYKYHSYWLQTAVILQATQLLQPSSAIASIRRRRKKKEERRKVVYCPMSQDQHEQAILETRRTRYLGDGCASRLHSVV